MKIVDLTMTISPKLKVFRGSPTPTFITWSKLDTHGYSSEVAFMSTHTGTHVDASSHFFPGSPSIERFPIRRFVCNAVLLQITKKENQLIHVKEIAAENITKNDTVVFSTGWERRTKSENYLTANPGLSKDAAKYLVERKINAVGIDGPSIDAGAESNFPSHQILLENNILIIENLCNLFRLIGLIDKYKQDPRNSSNIASKKPQIVGSARKRQNRFTLVVNPLKLAGASGSPVRAIGIIPSIA